MFDWLIRFSIANRLLVLLAAAAVIVFGARVLVALPVDVFPDLNRPTVTVMAESGGLSPEEVELRVTRPLEAALAGAPGVERVRSQSAAGLAVIWVEFGWDTDLWRDRQQVTERLDASVLPPGVVPRLGPVSSIMGEILLIGLVSPNGTVAGPALRTLAETVLRPRLLAIPGVSQVLAMGGGVEQVAVLADPVKMAALGVPLDAVRAAAAASQGSTTGGFWTYKGTELLVRNLARSADPEAIAQTVVAEHDGIPVPLGQVASVVRAPGPMRGDAGVNGQPAVVLSVQKQPGSSTLVLTAAVGEALSGLGLPAGVEAVPLFRQADFIEAAIANVEEALRDGAVLVAIILVIFLLNLRTTAITLTAIPLSALVCALVLHAFGLTINTMTLGGLAVAIGELVDDAVVDVENVYRRLRENARSEAPRSALVVVAEASGEVRNAIVFSTALVVLVFVPLFALDGVEGRLFAPLGVAYITAILASMLVSLTVTPALCTLLLPAVAAPVREHLDGALVRRLKAIDARALAAALPRPGLVGGITALFVLLAAASLPYLGTSYLPPFNEGTATINLLATPGISLEASDQLGQMAEKLLLTVPEVQTVGRRTGRAEQDEHAEGVHYAELDVDFKAGGRPRAAVLADIRRLLAEVPGVTVSLGQPISHRLDHLLSGVRAQIAVKVFGPDLAVLRATAGRLADQMRPIPGLVDLQVEQNTLIPQLQIEVNRAAALRAGLTPGQIIEDLETALAGQAVATVQEGARSLDLVVRMRADADRESLAALPVLRADGRWISLGQLAEIRVGTGPNQVSHEGGQRRIAVAANTQGRDLDAVVADVQAAITSLGPLPEGVFTVLGGQHESQRAAARQIALLSVVSLVAMYALLFAHFRSHALVAQVLLNIPLAMVGAVASVWLSGQPLSVASLVGFVTLCGIASRNTILMISHYVHLARYEGMAFGPELVVRGSLERLVPVAMTALCAGLGLLPLALAAGEPGKEILTPVASVILGGLVSSTLLDLVVTPTMFLRFGREALVRLAAP